ncbi:type II toxin-antitoxin system RelE/ParE family toxin [Methanomicrobium antiquum]|uniref:Type II toxin-antitoxin system RelE/ParE family toxin n=1 Tax=Methanomicrobium antiquum TaxID=487686 RepID=A0AAF0FS59_9EURY|nr:type II toxin-antitoxin system RelE/ParE family toxin [Methanomicrobium antiquum]WFN36921.1 type II toxin-antitoxin system RelE/ParE family toxin [Methanomicrobium antiquum]
MVWKLRYSSSAGHSLKKMPRETVFMLLSKLKALSEEDDPRLYLKELKGFENPHFYSLRAGQYRAVMTVLDDLLVIYVVEAGHRSSVYRKF